MDLTISQTAEQLSSAEDILILTHRNPDGDTLGSGLPCIMPFVHWESVRQYSVPTNFQRSFPILSLSRSVILSRALLLQ